MTRPYHGPPSDLSDDLLNDIVLFGCHSNTVEMWDAMTHHHLSLDHQTALKAYCEGDRLGALWESNRARYQPRGIEEVRRRASRRSRGTDESDIVKCFEVFSRDYHFSRFSDKKQNVEKLLVDWARYHAKHHTAARYGNTWKDYFRMVVQLDRQGNLSCDNLFRSALQRGPRGEGSAGNGCLALALPIYVFAREHDLHPGRLIRAFFHLSHAHEDALQAGHFLYRLFQNLDFYQGRGQLEVRSPIIREYYEQSLWRLEPAEFARCYPHNVLAPVTVIYALYAVQNSTSEEEVVSLTVSLGGDVDSTLALALMLHRLFEGADLKARGYTASSLRPILIIEPDHGETYGWLTPTGPVGRSRHEGGLADTTRGFPKACAVSRSLEEDFEDWYSQFVLYSRLREFSWPFFHRRGLQLCRRLKAEVGDRFVVQYVMSIEDPSCRRGGDQVIVVEEPSAGGEEQS